MWDFWKTVNIFHFCFLCTWMKMGLFVNDFREVKNRLKFESWEPFSNERHSFSSSSDALQTSPEISCENWLTYLNCWVFHDTIFICWLNRKILHRALFIMSPAICNSVRKWINDSWRLASACVLHLLWGGGGGAEVDNSNFLRNTHPEST